MISRDFSDDYLSTVRMHLRPLRQSDDAALFLVTSDPEVMRFWDWPEHTSPTITTAFVAALLEEVAAGKAHYWAICLGRKGRVIGTSDLSEIDEHHRRAEVGFMVAREYWGKGYAFEAMHTVIEYAVRSIGIERFRHRHTREMNAPRCSSDALASCLRVRFAVMSSVVGSAAIAGCSGA